MAREDFAQVFCGPFEERFGTGFGGGAELGLPLPAMQLAFKAYEALSKNGMDTLGTQALAGSLPGSWGRSQDFLQINLESGSRTRNTFWVGVLEDPLLYFGWDGGLKMNAIRVKLPNF